jgi:hypothetical protein
VKRLDRSEAIQLLRRKCVALVDDEHSLCDVANSMKILCHGWSQWSFGELKQRHDWIVKRRPRVTRKQLEDLGNRWQLARQFVTDSPLACDTQLTEGHHRVCRGWDEFSEEQLAQFVEELTGEKVEVVADAPDANEAPS